MSDDDRTAKAAWDEASSQLSGLGLKLKLHYQEKKGSGEAEQTAVSDAVKRLGAAVEDAVGAIGAAAKDPAVKEDVKAAAGSLRTALSASFSEIQDDIGKRFAKPEESSPWNDAGTEPRPETPAEPPRPSGEETPPGS